MVGSLLWFLKQFHNFQALLLQICWEGKIVVRRSVLLPQIGSQTALCASLVFGSDSQRTIHNIRLLLMYHHILQLDATLSAWQIELEPYVLSLTARFEAKRRQGWIWAKLPNTRRNVPITRDSTHSAYETSDSRHSTHFITFQRFKKKNPLHPNKFEASWGLDLPLLQPRNLKKPEHATKFPYQHPLDSQLLQPYHRKLFRAFRAFFIKTSKWKKLKKTSQSEWSAHFVCFLT